MLLHWNCFICAEGKTAFLTAFHLTLIYIRFILLLKQEIKLHLKENSTESGLRVFLFFYFFWYWTELSCCISLYLFVNVFFIEHLSFILNPRRKAKKST